MGVVMVTWPFLNFAVYPRAARFAGLSATADPCINLFRSNKDDIVAENWSRIEFESNIHACKKAICKTEWSQEHFVTVGLWLPSRCVLCVLMFVQCRRREDTRPSSISGQSLNYVSFWVSFKPLRKYSSDTTTTTIARPTILSIFLFNWPSFPTLSVFGRTLGVVEQGLFALPLANCSSVNKWS